MTARVPDGEQPAGGEGRDALAEARQNVVFTERLAQRMAEDGPLLDRIEALDHGLPDCSTARLVESRNGGALLVYECECGARLIRSREQAERDAARPRPAEPTVDGLAADEASLVRLGRLGYGIAQVLGVDPGDEMITRLLSGPLAPLLAERDRWQHATEVLDEALTEARSKLARVAALRRLAGDGVISSDALAYALDGT